MWCDHTHLMLNLLFLQSVMAYLSNDIRVLKYIVRTEISEGVRSGVVIVLAQSSKDGLPMRCLRNRPEEL